MVTTNANSLPRLTDEYIEKYENEGHWSDRTFVEHFEAGLEANPRSRIVGPDRTVEYSELADEVERVSAGLQSLGIETGDVVSYQLPNWVSSHVLHLAISRVGAIANPIIPIYRRSEVGYILENSQSSCVIIPDSFRDFNYPAMLDEILQDGFSIENVIVVGDKPGADLSVDATTYDELVETNKQEFVRPQIGSNDIHALLYTSGTTADPKGVLHTHNTLMCEERNTIELLGLSSETTVFMPSPVTHITGLIYALEMPFVEGMDVVLMDQWDPADAIDLIDSYACNLTVGATPFLQGLLDEAPEGWENTLRVFACGGADVPPDLVRTASQELGCTTQRIYGSTEYPTATWPPLDAPVEKLAETDGPPSPDAKLKVVDLDTRKELPAGEKGELLGHGPELMVGYLGEELNEDAFDDEWFITGDLAIIDEDGYIQIAGRKKDIIIRGGENIPVKHVEDRLYEHPAIDEVAVVAMPDERVQEKGCAYIKSKDGKHITLDQMIEYLEKEGIAKQKFPERLEIIEEFPMTASGKIQKNELRERVAEKLGMEPVSRG